MKILSRLFWFLFILIFLVQALPVVGSERENLWTQDFEEVSDRSDSTIFSDPGFSQSTSQFSPEQIVYVQVKINNNGDQQKLLRLLDSNKKEIERIILSQSGSGPFVFTTSFSSPKTSGIYYVDIKIESDHGSVFTSQQNITVGDTNGMVEVSADAESIVDTGGSCSSCGCGTKNFDLATPTPESGRSAQITNQPSVTQIFQETPPLGAFEPVSFLTSLRRFFNRLFKAFGFMKT